ncbi:MAG: hypothetical protein ACYSTG_08370, partial [Planctomycetota bacterium]
LKALLPGTLAAEPNSGHGNNSKTVLAAEKSLIPYLKCSFATASRTGIMLVDLKLLCSRVSHYAQIQISIHNISGRNIGSVHFARVLGPNAASDRKRTIETSIQIREASSRVNEVG